MICVIQLKCMRWGLNRGCCACKTDTYLTRHCTQSYDSENGAKTFDSFMQIAKKSCVEVFFKLLKIAENLREQLTV